MNTNDETSGKKKNEKLCTDNLSVSLDTIDTKKSDKTDAEDPKPRIVLTFRSEKSSAKSNNMKIVSTEEKHEEFSPRRSSRTRGKWEWVCDSDTSTSPKKYKSASENDETEVISSKRSTSRRSKETDNVVANAIARKEKLYDYMAPQRSTRKQKPKPTDDTNIQSEKLEEGVRTRRSAKPSASEPTTKKVKDNTDIEVVEIVTDDDGDSQNSVMKLKHLCELGLKAINTEDEEEAGDEEELEDNDEDAPTNDDEIDDDSEVISKLLEADDTSSDEDFYCSEDATTGEQPRRSKRLCSSFTNDSDCSSQTADDEPKVPRRRSSRRTAANSYNDNVEHSGRSKRKRIRSQSPDELQSEVENEENSNPAGGEEGSEPACPDEESAVIATCYCETPSNVYAASEDLIKPVFCQAVELVDGIRVGCCHIARKEEGGEYAPLVRAGPRAPYFLACSLHTRQLLKHMCCSACGLFCTQGIFYQCSKNHLFHLECGVPYNDAKVRPGCPHCGVYSYRWQPVNRECCKVQLQMNCSNKRIFLPDQREQCTPAYLSFSTLSTPQLDNIPVIPEELLPPQPIDLKMLCEHSSVDNEEIIDDFTVQSLYDAILADETIHQLIPKIVRCKNINEPIASEGGGTCMHAAAVRGHVSAAHVLRAAGAQLDVTDTNMRTPLLLAVSTLLDKSDKRCREKPKESTTEKESAEETAVDLNNESETIEDGASLKSGDGDQPRPKDEELVKIIRYLVAAGCDVNIADSEGMTALHVAAQKGSVEVCRAVMQSSSALVETRDLGGWTPLVWAAENNNVDVARYLLKEGADATSTDNEGNGAVHWCALAGASACLPLLLQHEPELLHALNAHGDTPLHIAARQGHFGCVVILLARGAKTDVENSAGEVPADVCTGQCHSAVSLNMQMTMPVNEISVRPRILSHDISNGREHYPIPCVNEVDGTPAPDEFTYVTRHVMPQHVPVDDTLQTMQGCSCKDGDCSSGACACCVLSVRSWVPRGGGGRLHHTFPYHDPPMIFECNETCACNAKKCSNRTITRLSAFGATFVRSEVFRCAAGGGGGGGGADDGSGDGGRGWGLRARRLVRRGTPVATYRGELVPAQGADARPKDHYMFALDINEDLLERCSEEAQLCVDAAQYGSSARFVNHSCRPNLVPVRVFTSLRDLRLPDITLFAATDIRPMDEFTFDYGDKFWSVKSKWMKCECGAPDCRYPVKCDDSDA